VARNIRRDLNGANSGRAASRLVDYWSGVGQWAKLAPEIQASIAARMPVIDSHFVSQFRDVIPLRDFARLDAPVLYMTGRKTRVSMRRIAELMTYALPRVDPIMMAGMGHLGPITHPDAVADCLAHFVRAQAASAVGERRAA
jgi:pimeloyl-ACP methyl ester carboxylesterase